MKKLTLTDLGFQFKDNLLVPQFCECGCGQQMELFFRIRWLKASIQAIPKTLIGGEMYLPFIFKLKNKLFIIKKRKGRE